MKDVMWVEGKPYLWLKEIENLKSQCWWPVSMYCGAAIGTDRDTVIYCVVVEEGVTEEG